MNSQQTHNISTTTTPMNSRDNTTAISATTLKRIYRDLQELESNPLPGIGICMPNPANPLKLHANLRIMDGVYKDLLLHLIIRLPPNYPHMGPAVNIAPGLDFGPYHHAHIHCDEGFGNEVCLDLVTNVRFMYDDSRTSRSGWTSAYTLSTLMIQLQVFFMDPDFRFEISRDRVKALFEHVKAFKLQISLGDGNFAEHSYDNPYPPIDSFSKKGQDKEEEMEISMVKEMEMTTVKEIGDDFKKIVAQKLYCFASRCTIFDETRPVLGFPIKIAGHFPKWFNPLFELMSADSYEAELGDTDRDSEDSGYRRISERTMLKSGLGDLYNHWMPIYINEEHWARAKPHVLKSIALACANKTQKTEATFRPQMVLKVLPAILSGIIFSLVRKNSYENLQAVEAYCFFHRLFLRLLEEFPFLRRIIDQEVEMAISRRTNRRKDRLHDVYKFFVMLSVSKYGVNNSGINGILIEELFARQVEYRGDFYQKGLNSRNVSKFLRSFVNLEKEHLRRVALTLEFSRLMKETSIELLDRNYGFLPEEVALEFIDRIAFLADQISKPDGWKIFLECVHSGESDLRDMTNFLSNAVSVAEDQRYVERADSRIHDFDVQASKKAVKVYVAKQSESEAYPYWSEPKFVKVYTPKVEAVA